jgi:hypothetical protein
MALRKANELVQKKTKESQFAFLEELEHIGSQFETLKRENINLQLEKREDQNRIQHLETIITQLNNFIETTGYCLDRRNQAIIPSRSEAREIEEFTENLEADFYPKAATKALETQKGLLHEAFNFYSFGVDINRENSNQVSDHVVYRLMEKRIADLIKEKEDLKNEVITARNTVKTFKRNEEESMRKFKDLETSYKVLSDSKSALEENFDIRLNKTVRYLVIAQKSMTAEYERNKKLSAIQLQMQ